MTDTTLRRGYLGATPVALRATKPYRPGRALLDTIGTSRRFARACVRRTVEGEGGLDELAAMVAARDEWDAAIDACAAHLLETDDCSYREVGQALGITRQAAQKRYPNTSARPSGGQRAALR